MPWRWPWYRKVEEHTAADSRNPLREFVYLDEVSVYSLLASRSGAVPTDFTETETESLSEEASSGLSVGVAATKVEVGERIGTGSTVSSQIVRKSSAQARFKQFLEAEESGFVFSTGKPAPERIGRGDLFEMEVELDADETFRISTTITSLVEILSQGELFAAINTDEIGQVVAFNQILERLLVGLVPIRAKAVDYAVAVRDGVPEVVRGGVPFSAGLRESEELHPLFIVGFAEQSLFWKDLRTVLFGGHRFNLTGRIAVPELRDQWSPVKLVEVLKPLIPALAQQLDEAPRGFAEAIRASSSAEAESSQESSLVAALDAFVEALGPSREIADDVHRELRELVSQGRLPELDGSLEKTRSAFELPLRLLHHRMGAEAIDPERVAEHRSRVIATYGLPPAPPLAGAASESRTPPPHRNEWFLEAEVIALYW